MTPVGAATRADKDVVVTNTAANPVPTTVVGTPSVSVANTPTVNVGNTPSVNIANTPTVKLDPPATPVPVRQVEQPYLARVSASNIVASGGEDCTEIEVPDGFRLLLETFTGDINRHPSQSVDPRAYIMVTTAFANGAAFDRGLTIAAAQTVPGASTYAANLRTRMFGGPVSVGTGTIKFALCAGGFTSVEGVVSGRLLPL